MATTALVTIIITRVIIEPTNFTSYVTFGVTKGTEFVS